MHDEAVGVWAGGQSVIIGLKSDDIIAENTLKLSFSGFLADIESHKISPLLMLVYPHQKGTIMSFENSMLV